LVAGPGLLSLSTIQQQAVKDHLAIGGILLLDAGAIPFLEQIPTEYRQNILITPHHGEFATHFPDFSAQLQSNPLESAQRFVGAYGCHLLLKGPRTLIVSPDEIPVVNMRGSAALATAGSGDVLAGIVGNLMARTGSIRNSAIAGAFIHGKAGESLTAGASELIEILPFALR
ncbi:MAG: NAD(P)H-hydrate dehydratase, partial [Actinobacteria bacterium]|nr:NAD(P)H-hydrate dehydratase [Actinomycetota bacterium]